MTAEPSTVEVRHVVADLLPGPGSALPVVPVQVRLVFDTAQPFAVLAEFRTGSAGWVPWLLGRALLAEGLARQVGGHDVTVEPAGAEHVQVRLAAAGTATLLFERLPVAEFLDRTFELAAADEEFAGIDWDASAAAVLPPYDDDQEDRDG